MHGQTDKQTYTKTDEKAKVQNPPEVQDYFLNLQLELKIYKIKLCLWITYMYMQNTIYLDESQLLNQEEGVH